MFDSVLVWFRRDLRDADNTALSEALRRARKVYCCFIFDREILDSLPHRTDRRIEFIHRSLLELDQSLRRRGGVLLVRHARAAEEIPRLASELQVSAVFTNRDYEPQAKRRDADVARSLLSLNIDLELFKDQVVFDGPETLTQSGRPFTVFTPYKNAWLKRLTDDDLAPGIAGLGQLVAPPSEETIPSLEDIGFLSGALNTRVCIPGMTGARHLLGDFLERIDLYHAQRDFPGVKGVSYLSAHLRFGTISIRELVAIAIKRGARKGNEGAATWLSELIWRDFYFAILDHFPHSAERSFKPEYDAIEWECGSEGDALFEAWCEARTGYPLVDAAMRQLNTSGYMHNRLRMIVASFLTKDLGVSWQRGEAWFARQLLDFDLAANNGGWQWAASSGCDAQPYFRIFNPITQSERFDPTGRFIRRYLPELAAVPDKFIHTPWKMTLSEQESCSVVIGRDWPAPIVDHSEARQRTLLRYAAVKRSAAG